MAHIIFTTKGSGGDLLPFIHIGKQLKEKEHQVTLFTHYPYREFVTSAGFDFVALDTEEAFRQLLLDQDTLRSKHLQGLDFFYRHHILPQLIWECEQISQLSATQPCVLICNSNSFLTAQLAAEKLGLPLISIFMSPAFMAGLPVLSGLFEALAADINQIRQKLNLAPISNWHQWLRSASKNLGLWPEWFAPLEPDWPADMILTGFVRANENPNHSIPQDIQAFLQGDKPTILLTHGTTKANSPKFFEALVEGCHLAGYRGLLVTQHTSSIPDRLPDSVMWCQFLPFTQIMPQVTAVAHHGGIGTTNDGLTFGRPQLILPDGLDCFDNAARVKQLGVGHYLAPDQWQPEKVAELLTQLLQPAILSRCQEWAHQLRQTDALTTICQTVTDLIPTQPRTAAPPMKILLIQRSAYFPTRGGADKANRSLIEALAGQGHVCRVVMPAVGTHGFITRSQLQDELTRRAVDFVSLPAVEVFQLNGVEVHAITDSSQQRAYLEQLINAFAPTQILVSSEDSGQVWLETVLQLSPASVIYLAHTPLMLPFGPQAFLPSPEKTKLFSKVRGIVAASHYLSAYIQRWSGRQAAVIPYPVYGSAPFPHYGRFDEGYVTMINPCAYKGISIFIALAQALPHIQFAAVPTWGTTDEERLALAQLANVHLLPAVDDIDDIYAQTRILLVPSLWAEAFGLVVVEAMLRGIPVLASDTGGLSEAKLGVDYVLPVRQIENYSDGFDDQMKPKAIVLEQDIDRWLQPLQRLLTDKTHYEQLSADSRQAAHQFVSGISITRFESYLQTLPPQTVPDPPGDNLTPQEEPDTGQKRVHDLVAGLSPAKRALLLQKLRQKQAAQATTYHTIPKLPRQAGKDNLFPASFAQQRLWLSTQLGSDAAVYSAVSAFRLSGRLDYDALTQSIDEIIRRHEVLRTTFAVQEGKLVQVIRPFLPITIEMIDLTPFPPHQQETKVRHLTAEEDQRPFDLADGPLLRLRLAQLNETEHVLLLTMHHIVCDGWSVPIFLQEMATLYTTFTAGKTSPLPPPPLQYADYAVWQRTWLQGLVLDKQITYWKRQLGGHLTQLALPVDQPQPGEKRFQGETASLQFSPSLTNTLKAFSKQEGTTLFMTLLAAFKLLLHYYGGQNDVIVGTDIANRNHVEIEKLIGFFTNQLVLRTDLSGNPTFRQLLHRVRQVALAAYAHQDLPFEKVVEMLNPERHSGHNPLFQVKFVLHTDMLPAVELPGIKLDTVKVDNKTAKFDLLLNMWDSEAGLFGFWEYNVDLFSPATITQMSHDLNECARIAVAQPDADLVTLRQKLAQIETARQAEKSQAYKETLQKKLKRVRRKRSSS